MQAGKSSSEGKLSQDDKGQQRTPEFLACNPFGKVPFLQDGDFGLPESGAIARYLAEKFDVSDNWWPQDIRARAKVNAALEWSFSSLRSGAARLCWHRVIAIRRGLPNSNECALEAQAILETALRSMEDIWLRESAFLAGNQMSIADLFALSELEQLTLLDGTAGGPTMSAILEPFPPGQAVSQQDEGGSRTTLRCRLSDALRVGTCSGHKAAPLRSSEAADGPSSSSTGGSLVPRPAMPR
eukprot:CAMPEP_0177582622 /NCGR_PEP_ID=MMETSP0419_2-20121207/2860_1 /TAXON_ID=582737 /ORGANISM="Tetraselmis sp., Strain GSL018" /LENGTH=240 /DNA_ID=CAMNT_0019071905 /DNA_START=702 /DNA_END=1421 /DNA_ORIENTATION=-